MWPMMLAVGAATWLALQKPVIRKQTKKVWKMPKDFKFSGKPKDKRSIQLNENNVIFITDQDTKKLETVVEDSGYGAFEVTFGVIGEDDERTEFVLNLTNEQMSWLKFLVNDALAKKPPEKA